MAFVLFVVGGTFYAPKLLDHVFHWFVFAVVSAVVFGYQIRDFWTCKGTLRFWLVILGLFICHFEFWVRYVHPHFGGDPRWIAGGTIAFVELVVVSIVMRLIFPAKTNEQPSRS